MKILKKRCINKILSICLTLNVILTRTFPPGSPQISCTSSYSLTGTIFFTVGDLSVEHNSIGPTFQFYNIKLGYYDDDVPECVKSSPLRYRIIIIIFCIPLRMSHWSQSNESRPTLMMRRTWTEYRIHSDICTNDDGGKQERTPFYYWVTPPVEHLFVMRKRIYKQGLLWSHCNVTRCCSIVSIWRPVCSFDTAPSNAINYTGDKAGLWARA